MKKEMQIVENRDLLTPEDFADWDEGKLSTKKTYKTAQKPCTAAFPSKVHRCTRNDQEPIQGTETRFFDYTNFRKVSYNSFLFFGKGKNKLFCFSERKQLNKNN